MSNPCAASRFTVLLGRVCLYPGMPDFPNSLFSHSAFVLGKELGWDIRFFFDTRIECLPPQGMPRSLFPRPIRFSFRFPGNEYRLPRYAAATNQQSAIKNPQCPLSPSPNPSLQNKHLRFRRLVWDGTPAIGSDRPEAYHTLLGAKAENKNLRERRFL